jgi:hypothetical protein
LSQTPDCRAWRTHAAHLTRAPHPPDARPRCAPSAPGPHDARSLLQALEDGVGYLEVSLAPVGLFGEVSKGKFFADHNDHKG